MKPTSIIFLVFALILFVGGFFTCKYAEKKAEADGTPIYDQTVNEDGSTNYSYLLDDSSVSSLKLVFNGVDVSVEMTSEPSHIEINNFGVNDYSVTLSGTSVTVDGTVNKFESFIDRSDGGIQFKGLRYLLAKSPDASLEKSVKVYINEDSKLNSISCSVKNGNLSIADINNPIDYSVNTSNGDVTFDKVVTISVAELTVKEGNFNASSCDIATLIVTSENGNVKVNSNGTFAQSTTSYDLSNESGTLIYNGAAVEGGVYKITQTVSRNLIRVVSSNGIINISDSD